jgi:hypothetical protein
VDGARRRILAHGVIVGGPDPLALTETANALERDLGSRRHYRAEALTSIAQAWQGLHGGTPPAGLEAQVVTALAEQLARLLPPRVSLTQFQH